MDNTQAEQIEQQLWKFCHLKGLQVTETRVRASAEFLVRANFSAQQISKALSELALEITTFPDVALITKKLTVSANDYAVLAANKILESAQYPDYVSAWKTMDSEHWNLLKEFFGTWGDLSNLSNANIAKVRPQLRDFIAAKVRGQQILLEEK